MRETSRPGKATVQKADEKVPRAGVGREAVANRVEASRESAKVLKHTDDDSEGTGVRIHCQVTTMLYTVDSGHANYTSTEGYYQETSSMLILVEFMK